MFCEANIFHYYHILLIQNRSRDEYLAWVDLLKQQFGLRFFIWDISQMGHFHLTKPIPTLYSNEPTTLMKDLAGKTMIVLNNQFEYGDNAQKVVAQNFVMKHEVCSATYSAKQNKST